MKKIIFFKLGALGDVLMTTPLIKEVRIKFPHAHIDYYVGEGFKGALEGNKNINNIITFDEKIFYTKNPIKLIKLIKKIKKEKYDIGFVLDKHWIFSLVLMLGKVKERRGFKRGKISFNTSNITYKEAKHEIDYYLMLLKNEVNENQKNIDFFLSKKDDDFGKKYSKERYYVIINSGGSNPGESGNIRRLPDKLFVEMVEEISKKFKVFLVGGKNDYEYYHKFKFGDNVDNISGKNTLKESVAIMKYADKIITTDCGAMHLASAVNKNLICIFGPTNPKRKAPLWKETKIIWKDEDIYDEKYELYGIIPKDKEFYKKIKVEDIIKLIN